MQVQVVVLIFIDKISVLRTFMVMGGHNSLFLPDAMHGALSGKRLKRVYQYLFALKAFIHMDIARKSI